MKPKLKKFNAVFESLINQISISELIKHILILAGIGIIGMFVIWIFTKL